MPNEQPVNPRKTKGGTMAANEQPIDWTSLLIPLCCIPFTVIAWQKDSNIVWNIVGLTAAVTGVLPLTRDMRMWFDVGRRKPAVKFGAIGMCALLVAFILATIGLLVTM
jgi:hypothetical protein